MTREEFEKFVDNYNKKPGEYTSQELYEIGVAHKQLDLKVWKDWGKLAEKVGYAGNAENYRKWVYSIQVKNGTQTKQTNIVNKENIEECSNDELSENLQRQLEELEKKKIQVNDRRNSYKRLIRDDARVEDFKNLLVEATKNLSPLPIYKKKQTNNSNVEAILLISDLHIGVECNNFYNKYNSDIAKKRVAKLVDDTITYCHRNNVNKLNVCNLGDLVHGIIHTSARLEQEMDVTKQIMTAAEILAEALSRLQEAAPIVTYRSVVDNHSRAIASKEESIEKENFSNIIDWWIKERLKNSSIQFENDNIDEGIGKFKLYNGKNVMFAHGHNDNINSVFQSWVGATGEYIHYCLIGHYHCEKFKSFQNSRIIVNGSIVGTEQYALSKRLFSKPSQTLLIFDNDNTLNISIDLDIQE